MNARLLVWGLPALFYAVFCFWYTDFGGALKPAEIDAFEAKLEAAGFDADRRARVRKFAEADSGRQFLMVNIIDMADDPPDVPGAAPGEDADQLMARYMEHMFRELFKRACHPVLMGTAVYQSMDIVGIEGAENWERAALMRYRSRRSFMEIVTNPDTRGRHEFKVAALEKTIAFPIETQIYASDPRFLLALILLSGTLLADKRVAARSGP